MSSFIPIGCSHDVQLDSRSWLEGKGARSSYRILQPNLVRQAELERQRSVALAEMDERRSVLDEMRVDDELAVRRRAREQAETERAERLDAIADPPERQITALFDRDRTPVPSGVDSLTRHLTEAVRRHPGFDPDDGPAAA